MSLSVLVHIMCRVQKKKTINSRSLLLRLAPADRWGIPQKFLLDPDPVETVLDGLWQWFFYQLSGSKASSVNSKKSIHPLVPNFIRFTIAEKQNINTD